jgi:hypothetical protein
MSDIMIDIETLDNSPTAQILTLAAVVFDPHSATNVTEYFYGKIDIDSYKNYPLQFTTRKSTLFWWMEQNEAARKEAFSGEDTVNSVMKNFVDWFHQMKMKHNSNPRAWSHGASFDIPIISNALSVLGIEIPWYHGNIRDTRTLFDLAHINLNMMTDIPLKGVIFPRHHALGDCTRQIEGVRLAYKKLKL